MLLRAELHMHTVLSPCAGVEMIPPVIVERVLALGLGLIAITDHNASANAAAVIQAARGTSLHVLPGMELQTREEVHLLCIFDTLDQAEAWQAIVDASLPNLQNDPEKIGEQFVVDHTGDLLRVEERLLAVSSSLSLEAAVRRVNEIGGLAIPAHVDRQAYGLIPMLGFVPPGLPVVGLEISRRCPFDEARRRYPQVGSYPLLLGGDVHYINDRMGANYFEIQTPSIAELRKAIAGSEERCLEVRP